MQSLDELVLSIRSITENPDNRVLPLGLILRHVSYAWFLVNSDALGKNIQEARETVFGKVNYVTFPPNRYLQTGSVLFNDSLCNISSAISLQKMIPHEFKFSNNGVPYQILDMILDKPIDFAFDVQLSVADGRSRTIFSPERVFNDPELSPSTVFVQQDFGFVDTAFYEIQSQKLTITFSSTDSSDITIIYQNQQPSNTLQTVAVYRHYAVFPHGFLLDNKAPKHISYKYIQELTLPESFSYLEFRYLECAAAEKIFLNQNMYDEASQWAELKTQAEGELKQQHFQYYDPFYNWN